MVDHGCSEGVPQACTESRTSRTSGTAQNPDIFFQAQRGMQHLTTMQLPGIVEEYMNEGQRK